MLIKIFKPCFSKITATTIFAVASIFSFGQLRAPAYPLVTIDPYTSCWSFTDKLYDQNTFHWTGKLHTMTGLVRVDGETFRFMGTPEFIPSNETVTTSQQIKYTLSTPDASWTKPGFDDSKWTLGKMPVCGGKLATKGAVVWEDSSKIWFRRSITLNSLTNVKGLHLVMKMPQNQMPYIRTLELSINGVLIGRLNPYTDSYNFPLSESVIAALKQGENIVAVYASTNKQKDRYIDFDLEMARNNTVQQTNVDVQATRTIYTFKANKVSLEVAFTSPLLMNDLDLLSRPISYVTVKAKSLDKKLHDVAVYFDAGAEWSVDKRDQKVTWDNVSTDKMIILKAGTVDQPVLKKEGDDVRIDWGYLYMAAANEPGIYSNIGLRKYNIDAFTKENFGALTIDQNKNVSPYEKEISLALVKEMGKVGAKEVSTVFMIGYDDIYSIEYFNTKLRAWWRRDKGMDMGKAIDLASTQYPDIMQRCSSFDAQLTSDAKRAGGEKYAEVCALAYRQAIAAHKLVADSAGNPLFLSKENFSNGSIGTVDVTYPSAPMFLIYNPTLLKGMMDPIFYYCSSGRFTKPFAPHDVGKYPLANGQKYKEDMPVEECGNMLILAAAIAKVEGNADYAKKNWKLLTDWANYLNEKGFDPENQLCTDDFAGHLAHNTNLSIKAILGIASYSQLADQLGEKRAAQDFRDIAVKLARKWQITAADTGHFSLTFDKRGTWSQKYNLVWDKLLNLNIFSPSIAETELKYYLSKQTKYGLPLDSRETYTKSDWILWTASMATTMEMFNMFSDPVYTFINETPDRVPITDWHYTDDAKMRGFRARSVVGGYFIRMLDDKLNNSAKDSKSSKRGKK